MYYFRLTSIIQIKAPLQRPWSVEGVGGGEVSVAAKAATPKAHEHQAIL